jgi:hypothetical protein
VAKKLKLGIIGMSDGNGHPYSWAALFNGYNYEKMNLCPFRVIPEYLEKEAYPENFLLNYGEVTHIWTQDQIISKQIAEASKISKICENFEDMIGEIDALLLARDDAENHFKFAHKFLSAGIPIYIDKPFALDTTSATKLWDSEIYDDQIFTCSALQFAREFDIGQINQEKIGAIKMIWATTPKSWEKYAVHIIEPVLNLISDRGKIKNIQRIKLGVSVEWESGISCVFQTTTNLVSPIWIRIQGEKGFQDLYFKDSFTAFKMALKRFVDVVNKKRPNLSKKNTEEMVQILEKGKSA